MHAVRSLITVLVSTAVCLFPGIGYTLDPDEILVVANTDHPAAVVLSRYYMARRKIPQKNLVQIQTTTEETCSRDEYDRRIAQPIRTFIARMKTKKKIRCLAVMHGLPLKIVPGSQQKKDRWSSVDSELSLALAGSYPVSGWVENPFYMGFQEKKTRIGKDDVLMVSRLDGPTGEIVKRIIDDSLKSERRGLSGTAYFDARWPDPGKKKLSGYALYDRSIHRAAVSVRKSGRMPVVIDQKERLFQPGDCPDAAMYCGWYSFAKYVDAFKWNPGSVGYHIASGELSTLKQRNSRVWGKRMLEEGIAATIGPVTEPYVNAFPLPEIFFPILLDGYLTLAETYQLSVPFLSWQMVLVGDPLYRPFMKYTTPDP